MEFKLKNELSYLMIFYALKKLYDSNNIDRETFDRLNTKNAESQGCKPVVI